jgi:2-methylcitrate dehydratase PrpD
VEVIHRRGDRELPRHLRYTGQGRLVLKDGTVYNIGETYPKGHPKTPVQHEEMLWKFRTLSERAIPDGERIEKIIDAVLHLERLDRFNTLADLLTTRA